MDKVKNRIFLSPRGEYLKKGDKCIILPGIEKEVKGFANKICTIVSFNPLKSSNYGVKVDGNLWYINGKYLKKRYI